MRIARLSGGSEADDLTQCVTLKISEGLPRFRGESSLSTRRQAAAKLHAARATAKQAARPARAIPA
jgi:hypothetical protein